MNVFVCLSVKTKKIKSHIRFFLCWYIKISAGQVLIWPDWEAEQNLIVGSVKGNVFVFVAKWKLPFTIMIH